MGVVHDLAGAEGVALVQQVLPAQLDGVDAEPVGHHVDDAFGGPDRLHRAVATERAAGRQVGVDAVGVDGDVVEPVGADAGVAHLLGDPGSAVGVGAGVDVGPDALGDEGSVALGAEPDPDGGRVPGDLVEDLVAVEHAAHRSAADPGGDGGDRLGADEGLGAEGAAHRGCDDTDVLGGEAEDAGQVLAHVERRLGAGDDLEPPARPTGRWWRAAPSGTCAAAGVWKTSSTITSASANASASSSSGSVQVGDDSRPRRGLCRPGVRMRNRWQTLVPSCGRMSK